MRQIENQDQIEELFLHLEALERSEGWQIIKEYLQDEMEAIQKQINFADVTRTRLEELTLKIKRNDCEDLLRLPETLRERYSSGIEQVADSDPYDKVDFGKLDTPR